LVLVPFRHVGQALVERQRAAPPALAVWGLEGGEDARLSAGLRLLGGQGLVHGPVQDGGELGAARAGRIEGAGFDQAFQRPRVELADVHTVAEVEERDVGALRLPRVEDRFNRAFANVLDVREPEADALLRARTAL